MVRFGTAHEPWIRIRHAGELIHSLWKEKRRTFVSDGFSAVSIDGRWLI